MKKFSALSFLLILIFFSPLLCEAYDSQITAGFTGLNAATVMKPGTSEQYKFQVLSGDSVLSESEYTMSLEVNIDASNADTSIADVVYDEASRVITARAKSEGEANFQVSWYAQIYLISSGKNHSYRNSQNMIVTVNATGQAETGVQANTGSSSGGGGCAMSHTAMALAALFMFIRRKK